MNTDKTVYFTFAVKLKKDFYTNVINTLENISDLKTSSVTPYNGEDAFKRIAKNNFWNGQDVGIIIRENKKQVHSQYFILKDIGSRIAKWNSSGYKHKSKYVNNYFTKKIRIDLLDSNGEILHSFRESCERGGDRYPKYYGFKGGLRSYTKIHVSYMSYFSANGMKNYIGKTNYCPSQLYSTRYDISKNSIIFDITNRKRYMFAFELDDINQLGEIQGIRIRYMN
jgi:hypothetical protein